MRFLSDNEREALLEACKKSANKALYPITLICLATGARKMEINALRWNNIDLKRNRITLTDTKNDEIRVLPFEDTVKNILQKLYSERKPKQDDLVFPSTILPHVPIEIRKHWYLAVEEADIQNFRFHDLRHSTASYLAMNGASLAEISEILGHKTLDRSYFAVEKYGPYTALTIGTVEPLSSIITQNFVPPGATRITTSPLVFL